MAAIFFDVAVGFSNVVTVMAVDVVDSARGSGCVGFAVLLVLHGKSCFFSHPLLVSRSLSLSLSIYIYICVCPFDDGRSMYAQPSV